MLSEDEAGEPWLKWHVNWTLGNTGLQQMQGIRNGTEGLVMSRS